jgi:hypothetical protein
MTEKKILHSKSVICVHLKTKIRLKLQFFFGWRNDHQSLIVTFLEQFKQVQTNFITGEKYNLRSCVKAKINARQV